MEIVCLGLLESIKTVNRFKLLKKYKICPPYYTEYPWIGVPQPRIWEGHHRPGYPPSLINMQIDSGPATLKIDSDRPSQASQTLHSLMDKVHLRTFAQEALHSLKRHYTFAQEALHSRKRHYIRSRGATFTQEALHSLKMHYIRSTGTTVYIHARGATVHLKGWPKIDELLYSKYKTNLLMDNTHYCTFTYERTLHSQNYEHYHLTQELNSF